ncbi:hypothetical protein MLD38_005405 [Melastoma candidum]|uniref:Uncharacterized protein n=1 Tax=Melastoma candidum TaxID=119954 RepID=A0ACB9RJL9_9MYRT|nr:hypothetical protein MLD38_005405 [Melastoma candidum]
MAGARDASAAPLALCLALALSSLSLLPTFAEIDRFLHPPAKDDGSLAFLVVGDWGRQGLYNQSEVAAQMGVVGERMGVDFVVSTGDNFYENGLTGVHDPAFDESYSRIYVAPSLQKQWYSVLGNHDYRGDVEAQLSPVLRAMDSRWLCLRSFIVNAGMLDIFMVDTNPFVDEYFTQAGNNTYDWTGVLPRQKYISDLLEDLDLALKSSRANWKMVMGHHPIKSAGVHGNTKEIVEQMLPILEANGVDFYVNGHDHCLQHISTADSPIQFLTSGGGSKAWRGVVNWPNPDELKLYYDGQGFMSVKIDATQADFVFYDVSGSVLHSWSRTKPLYSIV